METRAHYVAVGAFVLAMVFLAFVAALWLAGTQFAVEYAHYNIYFGGVTGLSKGARVDYNGVPVGKVSAIEIIPGNAERVRVTIEVDKNLKIRDNARAELETNLLSGVSTILITTRSGDGQPQAPAQAQAEPPPLQQPAGEPYPVIRPKFSTLAGLSARAPQLLDKLDSILEHLDEVLDDKNRAAFATIMTNIQTFTDKLAAHSDEYGEIATHANAALKAALTLLTSLNKSYNDPDGLKDKLTAALDDFDKLTKSLNETSRTIELTINDVRPGVRNFSQRTLTDFDAAVNEVRQFISGLSRLASELERDPTRVIFGDRREGYHPK
jgi:phospholipid/cholesterol/gamma-HCH transport system substrate-binding protein